MSTGALDYARTWYEAAKPIERQAAIFDALLRA